MNQISPLAFVHPEAKLGDNNIIGDMALIGKPIKGRIIATRPGHTVNNKFARLMRKEIRKHEIQAPIYDPNEEPIMDNIRIRQLLPHRYPMQLVDNDGIVEVATLDEVGLEQRHDVTYENKSTCR